MTKRYEVEYHYQKGNSIKLIKETVRLTARHEEEAETAVVDYVLAKHGVRPAKMGSIREIPNDNPFDPGIR